MHFSIRKLFQNAAYLITGNIGQAVLSLVQGVIIARTLGPSEYGVWGVVIAFSGITQAFLSFRTGESLTRYLIVLKENGNKQALLALFAAALLTDFSTRVGAYLVIISLSPWVVQYIAGEEHGTLIYGIYGLTVIASFADNLWYCVARDQRQFKTAAAVPFVLAAVQLAGILVLWNLDALQLLELAVVFAATALVKLIVNLWYVKVAIKKYDLQLTDLRINKLINHQKQLAGFWRFMKSTFWSSMVSTLAKNGDVLILGYYRTDAEVGWYRLAKNLVTMLQQFGVVLASVIYQDINELLIGGKIDLIKRTIVKILKFWAPTVIAGMFLAILTVETIIEFLYGNEFAPAVDPFIILLIGTVTSLLFFWAQPLVLGLEKIKCNFIAIVTSSLISTLAMICLGYFYGIIGVAWGNVLMWVTVNLMLVNCLKGIKTDAECRRSVKP